MTSTPAPRTPTVAEIARTGEAVLAEVATAVVGMAPALRTALATVLAGGHVLLEDVPGVGKTLAARSLATALGLDFRRLQCTPDLLPSDITGSLVYDPATTAFEFRPGPVFTGVFLADEINRTPPKTQSALLEAMAERQVTVEGTSHPLPAPFHVIATSNPVEHEGTYPLPEAQLDRFMVRLGVGYLDPAAEADVLVRRLARREEAARVRAVVDADGVRALQAGVEAVEVDRDVVAYCVDLAAATREHRQVEVGASPRGSQALVLVARALAVLDGRDFVTPEDVKDVAQATLAHRLTLTPQAWAAGVSPGAVVEQLLTQVPSPAATAARSS
ncbi:AAA family ATPase [Serinibacter arcticus]|uniref:ATPase n=1 Tax=Serinibacter arcticus TaxID=1655435 RepID=A0A4Z1E4E6_9MICO|nr:MoxR family ATPase [Serinibacter arcticus]TGO06150.1 ATPase [Serinibacter arcticus]